MEMMSQLPLPQAQVSNSAQPKSTKPKEDDTAAAEVVSFPTLLQDNKNAMTTGGDKQTAEEQSSPQKMPTSGLGATVEMVQPGGLVDGLSALILEMGDAPNSNSLVIPADTGKITPEMPAGDILPQTTETSLLSASETATPVGTAETTEPQAPASAETQTLNPAPVDHQVQSAATVITAETAGLESIETLGKVKVTGKGQATPKAQPLNHESKTTNQETKTAGGAIPMTEAQVEDSLAIPKGDMDGKSPEQLQAPPVPEAMKVEVVKDTPTPQQSNAPAVENPVLVRQASAELDLLSVQANAQKNYQQPAATTDQGAIAKPTLADLNLDSGSMESKEQNEQSIARILSSMNDTTSPVKRSIRGQILSGVVEHLQEEISKEKLTIRLNPEKLGQVEILFKTQGDQLNITINSSGREAEQAIKEGTKELAENIADRSQRWNLVDIRVENRSQDQQSKQESRQDERREKQNKGEHQQQEGHRSHRDHNQETEASEWAAFHLGG